MDNDRDIREQEFMSAMGTYRAQQRSLYQGAPRRRFLVHLNDGLQEEFRCDHAYCVAEANKVRDRINRIFSHEWFGKGNGSLAVMGLFESACVAIVWIREESVQAFRAMMQNYGLVELEQGEIVLPKHLKRTAL